MLRVAIAASIVMATVSAASAQPASPKNPHDIAEASRQLAEKREACRLEAKAQKLSLYQKRKYRLACLKR
jgi:hypothetical protein